MARRREESFKGRSKVLLITDLPFLTNVEQRETLLGAFSALMASARHPVVLVLTSGDTKQESIIADNASSFIFKAMMDQGAAVVNFNSSLALSVWSLRLMESSPFSDCFQSHTSHRIEKGATESSHQGEEEV